jgi:hypothetical protein
MVCMYVCMSPKFFQFHVGFHRSCAPFVLDLHYGKTKNTNMLGLPCLKGGLCYVAHECHERKQLFNI